MHPNHSSSSFEGADAPCADVSTSARWCCATGFPIAAGWAGLIVGLVDGVSATFGTADLSASSQSAAVLWSGAWCAGLSAALGLVLTVVIRIVRALILRPRGTFAVSRLPGARMVGLCAVTGLVGIVAGGGIALGVLRDWSHPDVMGLSLLAMALVGSVHFGQVIANIPGISRMLCAVALLASVSMAVFGAQHHDAEEGIGSAWIEDHGVVGRWALSAFSSRASRDLRLTWRIVPGQGSPEDAIGGS